MFGHRTVEYLRYENAAHLDQGGITRRPSEASWISARGGHQEYYDEARDAQRFLNEGKTRSVQLLRSAIEWLRDEVENTDVALDGAEKSNLTDHIGIHPQISSKCGALYASGTYAEAVEKSFKVVRDRLRELTGHETGSEAFGKAKLHIRGAAAPNVDFDFNEGAKFLMMAIDKFRNEKSHTSHAKIIDPARAQQYLMLSSLAMYLLDDAEIPGQ